MAAESEREIESRRRSCRRPLVDVFETDKDVVFQFELPGIDSEQIKVDVEDDVLRVETVRDRGEGDSEELVLREFAPTDFFREFILSRQLDKDNIAASWNNGVLTLKVPKGAVATHKIEIETL